MKKARQKKRLEDIVILKGSFNTESLKEDHSAPEKKTSIHDIFSGQSSLDSEMVDVNSAMLQAEDEIDKVAMKQV
ncbi:MAG: hypothetical protein AAF196_15120 [Planctomycetota bacterium]